MTVLYYRKRLEDRGGNPHRHQNHDHFDHRYRRGRMHGDAQLTVVGILLERVHVRHLGQSQQRQQGQTQQRGRPKTLRLRAAIPACIRQKSVQRKIPQYKNTQNWMRWDEMGFTEAGEAHLNSW